MGSARARAEPNDGRPPRAAWTPTADGGERAWRTALALRLPALAFSVPYLFAWSAGLTVPLRLAATGAHASLALAVGAWLSIADHDHGLHHRLGARVRIHERESAVVRVAALPLAVAAVVLSLPLLAVQPFLPALVGCALAAGYGLSHHVTPRLRYDGLPEVMLPLALLVLPGVALRVLAPEGPSWWSIVAGAGFLLALLLALSERDADRDAAAGIVTVSRRFGTQAQRARWLAGVIAAGSGLAGLYFPITAVGWLAIVGALGFLVGMTLSRRRVLMMSVAHGTFSLAVLFGLP